MIILRILSFIRACTARKTVLCVALALTGGLAYAGSPAHGPSFGNSAWVYDATYQNGHHRGRKPGSFVEAVNKYNRHAKSGRAITRVFPYGGDLEMYCHGNASNCAAQDLKVTFGHGGHRSVAAYAARLQRVDGHAVRIAPVLDGSIRGGYSGSLKGFNKLSPEMARRFADKVARRMCSDSHVAGVQFDLEPFDVKHKNGQYYFYRRIAADFSGDGSDPFHCVDADHPHGRYFSIFGSAYALEPGTAAARHVRNIMHAHYNGFYIVSLYDLSSGPSGELSLPEEYAKKARKQASMVKRSVARLKVPYQLAVPAAASSHEYAHCRGDKCKYSGHGKHEQMDYLKAGVEAIKASGAAQDPLFLGAAVWTWSRSIGHHGARVGPTQPTTDELDYLHDNM
jgi:hypothetical protein